VSTLVVLCQGCSAAAEAVRKQEEAGALPHATLYIWVFEAIRTEGRGRGILGASRALSDS